MPQKKSDTSGLRRVDQVKRNEFVLGLHLSTTDQYVRVDSITKERGTVILRDSADRGRVYAKSDHVRVMTEAEVNDALD